MTLFALFVGESKSLIFFPLVRSWLAYRHQGVRTMTLVLWLLDCLISLLEHITNRSIQHQLHTNYWMFRVDRYKLLFILFLILIPTQSNVFSRLCILIWWDSWNEITYMVCPHFWGHNESKNVCTLCLYFSIWLLWQKIIKKIIFGI